MVHDGRHDGIKGLAGPFGCSLIGHSRVLHREIDVSLGVGFVMGQWGLGHREQASSRTVQQPTKFAKDPHALTIHRIVGIGGRHQIENATNQKRYRKVKRLGGKRSWFTKGAHRNQARYYSAAFCSPAGVSGNAGSGYYLAKPQCLLAARDPRRFSTTTASSLSSSTTSL